MAKKNNPKKNRAFKYKNSRPNCCPVCDSYASKSDKDVIGDGGMRVSKYFTCSRCTSKWVENYKLSSSNYSLGEVEDNRTPYIPDTTKMAETIDIE